MAKLFKYQGVGCYNRTSVAKSDIKILMPLLHIWQLENNGNVFRFLIQAIVAGCAFVPDKFCLPPSYACNNGAAVLAVLQQ